MPLKGIPSILSPDLLHALSAAGHGDEILLADMNFPSSSICQANTPREIRADGLPIPALLEAILKVFPLDEYDGAPITLMERVPSDVVRGLDVSVWKTYQSIADKAEMKTVDVRYLERFAFYERAKKAFAVIHTGQMTPYGNIIIRKGVVTENN